MSLRDFRNRPTNQPINREDYSAIAHMRSKPKPSALYPILWYFASERQRIYLKRLRGLPPPWTEDPILRAYKFTNSFRASDRVSQYLIKKTYTLPAKDIGTLFLRTILFKIFNRIETWETLVDHLGLPDVRTFDFDACDHFFETTRASSGRLYSGAYIMPTGGLAGVPKHRMHLHLIRRMIRDRLPEKLSATKYLSQVYERFLLYPTFGPFLSYQYTIDLNYTTLINHSEEEFVVAGPGALDGLSKCFETLGDYTPEQAILWLTDIQENEFSRFGHSFDGLWGRPLQPIDIQNILCEVSKYTRITHPTVRGISGRTRIKQKFRMKGAPPEPVFPPKWDLNSAIDTWLELGPKAGTAPPTLQQENLVFDSPSPQKQVHD